MRHRLWTWLAAGALLMGACGPGEQPKAASEPSPQVLLDSMFAVFPSFGELGVTGGIEFIGETREGPRPGELRPRGYYAVLRYPDGNEDRAILASDEFSFGPAEDAGDPVLQANYSRIEIAHMVAHVYDPKRLLENAEGSYADSLRVLNREFEEAHREYLARTPEQAQGRQQHRDEWVAGTIDAYLTTCGPLLELPKRLLGIVNVRYGDRSWSCESHQENLEDRHWELYKEAMRKLEAGETSEA